MRSYGSKSDNNAHLFKKGQDRILQPAIDRGDVKVVFEDWVLDWKPENAKKIMNAAISSRGRKSTACWRRTTARRAGPLDAHRGRAGGQNTSRAGSRSLAACQRILRGQQAMTVYKPLAVLADSAANGCGEFGETRGDRGPGDGEQRLRTCRAFSPTASRWMSRPAGHGGEGRIPGPQGGRCSKGPGGGVSCGSRAWRAGGEF